MIKTVLKYGGISGIILVATFSVTLFLLESGETPDYALGEVLGYITMILSLSVVYLGIKNYRDDALQGSISFRQALAVGLLISAFASLVFTAVDTIYITLINPDFFTDYMAWEIESMKADGASPVELAAYTDQYKIFTGPWGGVVNALVMFMTVFLIGMIITLVSAGILVRKTGR